MSSEIGEHAAAPSVSAQNKKRKLTTFIAADTTFENDLEDIIFDENKSNPDYDSDSSDLLAKLERNSSYPDENVNKRKRTYETDNNDLDRFDSEDFKLDDELVEYYLALIDNDNVNPTNDNVNSTNKSKREGKGRYLSRPMKNGTYYAMHRDEILAKIAAKFAQMDPELLEKIREQIREKKHEEYYKKKAQMTEEEKAIQREKDRKRKKEAKSRMTQEEINAQNEKRRELHKKKRSEMTEEELAREREKQRVYQERHAEKKKNSVRQQQPTTVPTSTEGGTKRRRNRRTKKRRV